MTRWWVVGRENERVGERDGSSGGDGNRQGRAFRHWQQSVLMWQLKLLLPWANRLEWCRDSCLSCQTQPAGWAVLLAAGGLLRAPCVLVVGSCGMLFELCCQMLMGRQRAMASWHGFCPDVCGSGQSAVRRDGTRRVPYTRPHMHVAEQAAERRRSSSSGSQDPSPVRVCFLRSGPMCRSRCQLPM